MNDRNTNMADATRAQNLKSAVEAAKLRYVQNNSISANLHEEAARTLPGGNTRTVLHASPFPIYMKSGRGYQVTSEDGQTYVPLTQDDPLDTEMRGIEANLISPIASPTSHVSSLLPYTATLDPSSRPPSPMSSRTLA